MSAIEEAIEILFWGSGAWLGFILLVVAIIILTKKVPEIGVFTFAFLILLGIQYFNRIATNSIFNWFALFSWIGSVLCIFFLIEGTYRK